MAEIGVVRQVSEEAVREEAKKQALSAPPNLIWRLGIVIHHEKVRFVSTRDMGQACIVVLCGESESEAGIPITYREFQVQLYDMLSELPNKYMYFDHLGTFYAREGYLILEVHFSSQDQIARCLDGLATTVLTQRLRKCLLYFAASLQQVDLNASLVVFSNLDARLKQVLEENIEFAFRVVYNVNPTVAVFHSTNPAVYVPIKAAYDQLSKRFPDFFGDMGPVDIYPSEYVPADQNDTTKVQEQSFEPPVQGKLAENSAPPPTTTPVGLATGVPTASNKSAPSLRGTQKESTKDRTTFDLEPAEVLSGTSESNFAEELSDRELPVIGEMIPPDSYLPLGLILGLKRTKLERLQYDSKSSMEFILNILSEAQKIDVSRRTLAAALLQHGLLKVAKVVDPTIKWSDLPHIKLSQEGVGSPHQEGPFKLYLVDGTLHFYDQDLAHEHLKTLQPLSFWAALHKQLTSIIRESLQEYSIALHSSLIGSLVAKISLSSFYQALRLAEDIASGRFTRKVEDQLRSLGYEKQLGLRFEICDTEVTPRNLYKLYLNAIATNVGSIQEVPGLRPQPTMAAPHAEPHPSTAHQPHSMPTKQHSLDSKLQATPGKPPQSQRQLSHDTNVQLNPVSHTDQHHEAIHEKPKRQFSDDPSRTSSRQQTDPAKFQRSVSHDPQSLFFHKQMKSSTPMPFLQPTSRKLTGRKAMQSEEKAAATGVQITYTDANVLFYLIRKGESEKVRQMIEAGADLSQDDKGHLPIHVAAQCGKRDMVRMMVERGCNVDTKTKTDKKLTALHNAAFFGHLKVVQTLVELGADVEARGSHGWTPLRMAASHGSAEIAEFLLDSGAKCDSQCNRKETPLQEAISLGHKAVVKVLLKYGADVTLQSKDGKTPIHDALLAKNANILSFLLEANPKALTHPNVMAADPPVNVACKLNSPEMLNFLLQHKADPNTVNSNDRMTPLLIASANGSVSLIEILVAHGADISLCVPVIGAPLHAAAETGQVKATEKLLELGADPNVTTQEGLTPLMVAVEQKQVHVAEILIRHGANVDATNPQDGVSALHKAAKRNDTAMLKLLIASKANVNKQALKGNSALHVAAIYGNNDAVDVLCSAQCELHTQNIGGLTALLVALQLRKFETASRLLKYKQDLSICDKAGVTPLYVATDFRAVDIVAKLLDSGAQSDAPGPKGIAPIQLACQRGYHEIVQLMLEANSEVIKSPLLLDKPLILIACGSGSPRTLRLLLDHGADPNTISPDTQLSVLFDACVQGHITMVEDLISHGADPTLQSPLGTPLHCAVVRGQYKCTKKLLDLGVDPNITTGAEKATPLILAAEMNNLKMVKLLIERGASVDLALANGYTALHKAASQNFVAIAKLLEKSGANLDQKSTGGFSPLHMAASAGSMEVLQLLIESGKCNINAQDGVGFTPLMRALHDKRDVTAVKLIDSGANINLCSHEGLRPFHLAAHVGAINIARKLIDMGASPNVQDSHGTLPIHITVINGNTEFTKFLASNGSSVNTAQANKSTPLHIAAEKNDSESVQVLLDHGADPALRNSEQKTPADMTTSKNIRQMILSKMRVAPLSTVKPFRQVSSTVTETLYPGGLQGIAEHVAEAGLLTLLVQELKLPQNEWLDITSSNELDRERAFAALQYWKLKSKQGASISEKEATTDLLTILQKVGITSNKRGTT